MTLVFPNGRTLPVTAAGVVRLGRKDMLESTYAASISREQCSLSRSESGGVKLVTLGQNPTRLVRANGEVKLLRRGEDSQLQVGDKIGLHAALSPLDHLVYLSEAEAHTRAQAAQMQEQMEIEQQQQEQEQEVELPLLKRPRTEPDGPPTAAEPGDQVCPAAADAVDEIAPGVQVMVLLMGLPGSGKSTLCASLPADRWTRVNQDSINKGRKGTRKQCLNAAAAAMRCGHHVVVDRCGLTAEQRQDFVRLAQRNQLRVWAVRLHRPVELCVERAVSRVDHEGGVDGKSAETVVRRMLSGKQEHPTAAEGFHRVVMVQTDREHAAAASALAALPPSDRLLRHAKPSSAAPAGFSSPPPNAAAPLDTVGGRDPASSAAVPASPSDVQTSKAAPPARDALSVLMRSAKQYREGAGGSSCSSSSPLQPAPYEPPHARVPPTSDSLTTDEEVLIRLPDGAAAPPRRPWLKFPAMNVFVDVARDPAAASQTVVHSDDRVVVLYDKFAKAQHHLLVIARDPDLLDMACLNRTHVPLLEHMLSTGRMLAAREADGATFRFGFHARPSIKQLHLHVVSQDLLSPAMKHKKHWNGFTSGFFVPIARVMVELKSTGRVTVDEAAAERLLHRPLRCHRCGVGVATFPKLKSHLAECAAPPPVDA